MNTVHFIFQAKGGIGKSFIASLLAQHLQPQSDNLKQAKPKLREPQRKSAVPLKPATKPATDARAFTRNTDRKPS